MAFGHLYGDRKKQGQIQQGSVLRPPFAAWYTRIAMTSPAQLAWYRRMSPRDRTGIMREMMNLGWSILRRRAPEAVERVVAAVARLHLASTRALIEGLERGGASHRQTPGG